jgi:hypothetical protein
MCKIVRAYDTRCFNALRFHSSTANPYAARRLGIEDQKDSHMANGAVHLDHGEELHFLWSCSLASQTMSRKMAFMVFTTVQACG